MANIKIYGVARSRAGRNLWMARELGIPVDHVDISSAQAKEPPHNTINPAGKIPSLVEDDFVLLESLAINMYLAKKHSLGKLYPTDPRQEAKTWQWTLWVASEVDPSQGKVAGPRLFNKGDPAQADAVEVDLQRHFRTLEGALEGRQYLVSDHFTVADLNVAAVMDGYARARVDFSKYTNITAWLARCTSRPASKA